MHPLLNDSKVGITLGDPSGIGPEIVAKALCDLPKNKWDRIIIYGDKFLLTDAFIRLDAQYEEEFIYGFQSDLSPKDLYPGKPNSATGRAQVAYLEAAAKAASSGKIAALVTAPISKVAAQEAGFQYPGHTEFLADRLGAPRVAMMFAGPKLKVVLATVHEALLDLGTVLTIDTIVSAITLAAQSLQRDFRIPCPRIGVLGLNPHAGEQGRFGDQESTLIAPAIAIAQSKLGQKVSLLGPLVPDAAFRMDVDCFIAMYHDQGLIPVKLIDFDESVNTTLGLPIVRTSPDHGVAYDIAGQGIARATSMSAALHLAFRLIDAPRQDKEPPPE